MRITIFPSARPVIVSELPVSGAYTVWVSAKAGGGGYSLQRNVQLKLSFQRNTRSGGRVMNMKIGAAQLVFWF